MNALLVAPILIPMLTALSCVMARRLRAAQRWISVAGAAALLLAGTALMSSVWSGTVQATQASGWPAPFGITLVADLLSGIMVLITGVIGLAVVLYSLGSIDSRREMFGYHPLVHVLLMGVCGSFLTGDIFNLYVWFEVMLMSSFVLLVLGGERGQLEGAVKYVTLNLVSSAMFLAAVGILYGLVGTLNMADLAVRCRSLTSGEQGVVTTVSLMFMVAFGIKAGLFPLFCWLPASYHTPPAPVGALFAGLLTKVGVYAMIRVFTLIFVGDLETTHGVLLVLAGLTIAAGVLGATAQHEIRRILSFLIVSQIGYMAMGLGLMVVLAGGRTAEKMAVATLGLAGSVFSLFHHMIVKANLFLIAGLVERLGGSTDLRRVGGLLNRCWWLGLAFMIPALAHAGVPPLSGFFAKFAILKAGLLAERWALVAVVLCAGLLTLWAMMRVWAEAFWKPAPEDAPAPAPPGAGPMRAMGVPVLVLAAMTVSIGLAAGVLFDLALRAAEQLLTPSAYIEAVLGAEGGGP